MTTRKAVSSKKPTTPVQLINEEILIRFKSPEERNKIEDQKRQEEARKSQELKKLELQKKRITILKNLFLFIFILFVGSFLFLVIQFVYPKYTDVVTDDPSKIRLAYTAPKYLAVGDENIIEITLENLDPVEPFNGTVTLIVSDPLNSLTSTTNGRMSIPIKKLLPNERLTSQYRVRLTRNPASSSMKYNFQITLSDETMHVANGSEFLISPVENVRSIWVWITGTSGLVLLLVNFFFDQFKSLVGVK